VENALAAWRAHNDPMVCQQFFQIQELSKSLSRIQSFFQAAPLATLQFVIYMESYHESSFEKGLYCSPFNLLSQNTFIYVLYLHAISFVPQPSAMLTFISIIVSLVVMTNANLPSKTDLHVEDGSLHKAAYLPLTRIFVGLRMFSSLGMINTQIHSYANSLLLIININDVVPELFEVILTFYSLQHLGAWL